MTADPPDITDPQTWREQSIMKLQAMYAGLFPSQSRDQTPGIPVIVNGVRYESIQKASIGSGIPRGTLERRLTGTYKTSRINFDARYA